MSSEHPRYVDGLRGRDREKILAAEWRRIQARRDQEELDLGEHSRSDLWGICFSGGGVRSATFGLGVLQQLIAEDKLRRFDYMSTVSGGGYIGSCLSSLLTGKHPVHRPDEEAGEEPLGVRPKTSPFVGLYDARAGLPVVSVRNQIHHLRTHGEYLAPRNRGLFKRDVMRGLGAVATGVLHHFALLLLALVALAGIVHLALLSIDGEKNLVSFTSAKMEAIGDDERGLAERWWAHRLEPTIGMLRDDVSENGSLFLAILGASFVLAIIAYIILAIHADRAKSRDASQEDTPAGYSEYDAKEHSWGRRVNAGWLLAVAVGVVAAIWKTGGDIPSAFLIPAVVGLGALVGAHLAVNTTETIAWGHDISDRSVGRALEGATVTWLIGGALFAVLVVVALSLHHFDWRPVALSLLSLGASYLGARRLSLGEDAEVSSRRLRALTSRVLTPLIFAAVFIAFSAILGLVTELVAPNGKEQSAALPFLGITGGGLLTLFVLGFFDANRVSPHHFYRDRLTEAYLQTKARVDRKTSEKGRMPTKPGWPLELTRDGSRIRLRDLGDSDRGPYHLLVASLNLPASTMLNRRTLLSDHFVFSRDYVGSEVTGYVRTDQYRDGSTTLARAMTISGAAASSAAGHLTSAWWSFILTLFNARLGFWIDNPWRYSPGWERRPKGIFARGLERLANAVHPTPPEGRRTWRWPARNWLFYLAQEMTGRIGMAWALVHVSDGGHTGDNLGLVPLLQRHCKLIVVCDAECDPSYTFGSFNTAVRMANTEENIQIEIDLREIAPQKEPDKKDSKKRNPLHPRSAKSVAVGSITYFDQATGREEEEKGILVYLKASVDDDVPTHVANYANEHGSFPHQTTADQFFDDAQFESYRALGQYVAHQALHVTELEKVWKGLRWKKPPSHE